MMLDVDERTVFALLRACLAGDHQGVAAICETAEPFALIMALAAWSNEIGRGQYGSLEAWDRQLQVFLTQGPVDAG
jgi:hypothetical protein